MSNRSGGCLHLALAMVVGVMVLVTVGIVVALVVFP